MATTVTERFSPPSPFLHLEPQTLYLLLYCDEVSLKWHWSLYVHASLTSGGYTLHITRPEEFWFLDARTITDASYSSDIVCAVALTWVESELEDALKERVKAVPLEYTTRWGELTCRTWVLRVLEELDMEGWISVRVGSTVEDVEAEVKNGAAAAATGIGDRVLRSRHVIL
ncbi:hypothetical protein V495_03140 [Pseudogymnoascus sp. VKM F-4514 (FW-929)]|nr:hypothetical protein V495_03140 [Pseudogymnoascus sp. VKM F-4514 (FW-929)]KFY58326.1 hypothetical protein V497_04876 [Pseudogymnoascus sp. VKM F-4516 (FW-969)]